MLKSKPRLLVFFPVLFTLICLSCLVFAREYHTGVVKYKLPNQLTVILEPDQTIALVTIQIWVRTGSAYEGKLLGSGMSHLIEHMVFKGSETAASLVFSRQFLELGGELHAFTSKEYTGFTVTIPKENLEKALSLVNDVITKAEFPEAELLKEKEVIRHEMAAINDNPHKYLAENFWAAAFQGHPYGEPTIGHRLIFDQLKRNAILDYYHLNYIPQNIVLVLVGDFQPLVVKPYIEQLWGRLPACSFMPVLIPSAPPVCGPTRRILYREVANPYFIAGFYGPAISSSAIYALDVLAEIFGGGEDARIVRKLRDQLGWVTEIDAWSYTPSCTGIWGISADLGIDDWGKVLKTLLKEIYRLRYQLVREDELKKAKKRIERKYLAGLETQSGKARDLATNEIYTRNPEFTSTYLKGINKVTREDLRRYAREYFQQELFTFCVLEPEKAKPEETKQQGPEKDNSALSPVKLTNGLRILLRADDRLPLVTIRLVALGGLLEEPVPGLSRFYSQLWLQVNPRLVKEIEDSGGGIGSYSGNNSFGFSIQVLAEDIGLALRVAKELIQSLPVTKEKLELVRKLQLVQIKQEEDMPYSFAFKLAKNTFYNTHPYQNSILGTAETVSAITEEQISDFKNKFLVPENMVLVIFGDISEQEIINQGKAVFADLPARPFTARRDFPPLLEQIKEKSGRLSTQDTIVLLAYPGTTFYSEDRFSLELIEQLFSGLAGRLFQAVREDEALSYSVGALDFVGREPGMFMLYATTSPAEVKKTVRLLQDEINRLKNRNLSPEEITRLKNRILTRLQQQWESPSGLSLEVALDELYGLGCNYYQRYLKKIAAVTAKDIRHVANKYFKDDWYTLVVVGPEGGDQ